MFEHIKFPFFGLKKKPYSVEFTLDKIFVVRTEGSHKETVDDKNLQGDYFARLAQMDVRLDFDCTVSAWPSSRFRMQPSTSAQHAPSIRTGSQLFAQFARVGVSSTPDDLIELGNLLEVAKRQQTLNAEHFVRKAASRLVLPRDGGGLGARAALVAHLA